jgi:hypothetical protein
MVDKGLVFRIDFVIFLHELVQERLIIQVEVLLEAFTSLNWELLI